MEKILFVSILIAALALPSAMLTAVGAGLIRMFFMLGEKRGLPVLMTGSALPMAMLGYGCHLAWQPASGTQGDTLSLDWWLIVSAPPSWMVCLLAAWLVLRRPVSAPVPAPAP